VTVDAATRHRALSSPRRTALLGSLRAATEPMTVGALAAAVGLHVNTTREHLDVLLRAGLVVRSTEARSTRGRPRTLFAAAAEPDMRDQLSRVLLSGFGRAVACPAAAAERAGSELVAAERGAGDRGQQLAALREHFDRMGFDPELVGDEVRLRRCPVRELATERADIVCAVHLGLARGVLRRVGGPVTADKLVPFAGPGYCVLQLRTSEPASGPE
jgi:predicted ArsR family transcriptional regulator